MKNNHLAVASLLMLGVYFANFMRVPIMPLYAKALGASIFEVGLVSASFMVIAAILAIPFGLFSDMFGRKRLVIIGMFMSGTASFLLFFARTPFQLMLYYMLAGFGIAAFTPSMVSFVGDIAGGRMGRSYGWFMSAMQVGMASGPAAGGYIAGAFDFHHVFLFSGIVMAFAFLFGLMYFPAHTEKPRAVNTAEVKEAFASVTRNNRVTSGWLAIFSTALAFGVFMPFFPLYVRDLGFSALFIGVLFAVQSLLNATARVPFGYLSDKLGRREPFVTLGIFSFAFTMALLAYSRTQVSLIGIAILIGLTMGVTSTAISTLIAEAAPPKNRGLAMSGFSTSLYGGFAIASILGGKIISAYGFEAGFFVSSAICLVGAGLFYIKTRRDEPAGMAVSRTPAS